MTHINQILKLENDNKNDAIDIEAYKAIIRDNMVHAYGSVYSI